MRAPPLPSVEIAGDGRVYAAWHDCRFRSGCRGNDIVVSSSPDGATWTEPVRVPVDPVRSRASHFVPGLAVDIATAGGGTRLAVAYHSLQTRSCAGGCRVDVGIVASADGGRTWGRAQRLSAQSMPLAWIVPTTSGRMLGDYISTSFVGDTAVPVFSLASQPQGRRYNQAVFATRFG